MLLSNRDNNIKIINFKIRLVFFLIFVGLLVLWIRTLYIQIIWRGDLISRSRSQYWKRELAHGIRGDILSSDNELLGTTVVLKSVFAVPGKIQDRDKTSKKLSSILGISRYNIKKKLEKKRDFVWIKRRISDKQAAKISSMSLQGIYLTEEMTRVYPQKTMAGQLIGFVGLDNKGLEGVEKGLDGLLSGRREYFLVQRDGKGRTLYAPGQLNKDISGEDVYLTIDSKVQTICEEALARGVSKSGGRYGIALVVDVYSGNILAWAQYPFFNPNTFRSSSPSIWRNRIALDMFEPGSTMKPFVVAAAMKNKICDPKKIYYCEKGRWKFEDVTIRDTHPHGWLTVSKIIRYSSNIGIAKIGLELGANRLFSFLKALKFGETTHLPLPGEARGIFRDVSEWNRVDLANISFGQGISVTPLQLIRAYLCIASHGLLKPLNLVLNIENNSNKEYPRIIPKKVNDEVLSMLRDVVQKDGTGKLARISGVEIGGKTGTSQKAEGGKYSKDKYVACFVGLCPALDPKYLVFVLVDEPKEHIYGGVVAAPIVRDIFQGMFPMLISDLRNREDKKDVVVTQRFPISHVREVKDPLKSISLSKVPDFKGLSLREVLMLLSKKHLVPEVRGSGPVVVKQYPREGSDWKNRKIILWMGYK